MTLRPLDIRAALTADLPPIDFVLPGLPLGTTGALVAPGGAGKSMLALQTGVAFAAGLPVAGGLFPAPPSPSPVVVVAAEERRDLFMHRMQGVRNLLVSPPPNLFEEPSVDRDSLVDLLERNLMVLPMAGEDVRIIRGRERTEFFAELVHAAEGSRLVILDPARRLHDGDENSTEAMNAVVEAGEFLASRTGAAVLFLHHANKYSSMHGMGSEQAASRGSSALTDGVRWQCNLTPMTKEEARKRGLESERKSLVSVDLAKVNYGQAFEGMWLRRGLGGVLSRVELDSENRAWTRKPSTKRWKEGGGYV